MAMAVYHQSEPLSTQSASYNSPPHTEFTVIPPPQYDTIQPAYQVNTKNKTIDKRLRSRIFWNFVYFFLSLSTLAFSIVNCKKGKLSMLFFYRETRVYFANILNRIHLFIAHANQTEISFHNKQKTPKTD